MISCQFECQSNKLIYFMSPSSGFYSRIAHIVRSRLFVSPFAQDLFEKAVSRYIDQPEKKDLLLQLLQWMPSQGYVVDSSTRNLILKNSNLFGRQLVAEVLSRQHIKLKAKTSPWGRTFKNFDTIEKPVTARFQW